MKILKRFSLHLQVPMDNLKNSLSSVTLLLELNAAGNDYSVSQTRLSSWLKRYSKWFSALPDDESHVLPVYVDVYFLNLFSLFDKSLKLLESISACGCKSLIHVYFRDLVVYKDKLDVLKEKNLVKFVNVHFSEDDLPYKASVEKVFKELYKDFDDIQIYANYELLMKFDVYSSETLNRRGMTFFPECSNPLLANAPKHPVCACEKRLQICVDDKGFVYPCQGLASIGKCAIGHVSDKSFDHYLSYKCGRDDLRTLIEKGPSLKRTGKVVEVFYPWICRRHLYEIVKAEEK